MKKDHEEDTESVEKALSHSHSDDGLDAIDKKASSAVAKSCEPGRKEPLSTSHRRTLRARLTNILDTYAPDAMADLAQRNPDRILQWLVVLEPKEVAVAVHHEAISLVMYPAKPPEDWQPPALVGESMPIIDAEVDKTPANVGKNEG